MPIATVRGKALSGTYVRDVRPLHTSTLPDDDMSLVGYKTPQPDYLQHSLSPQVVDLLVQLFSLHGGYDAVGIIEGAVGTDIWMQVWRHLYSYIPGRLQPRSP